MHIQLGARDKTTPQLYGLMPAFVHTFERYETKQNKNINKKPQHTYTLKKPLPS